MEEDLKSKSIGAVFTPESWARWLLERYGVAEKWLKGATVMEPCCGEGFFLHALVDLALEQSDLPVEALPLHRLYGIDLNSSYLKTFQKSFKQRRGCRFPENNLMEADIILDRLPIKADILAGNPPWQNFTDLPESYKPGIKQAFVDSGLTGTGKELLLGGSRIDIAALVTLISIDRYLNPKGEALFFLPLSLLLNEGAHRLFRHFTLPGGQSYAVREVMDFNKHKIFPSVETRYGSIHFLKGRKTDYPIPWYSCRKGQWISQKAAPLFAEDDPLSILPEKEDIQKIRSFRLSLKKESQARQGVNTCGVSSIFIYTEARELDAEHMLLSNKVYKNVKMLKSCIYPLVSKTIPKHIIILHDRKTGKPFSPEYIAARPVLQDFVQNRKDILKNRKGALIKSWIKKGCYWACLGVGPYNFFKYKVLWQAFGTPKFEARIYGSKKGAPWQGNQAMHAYIPCHDRKEARRIRDALNSGIVQSYLDSFLMGGSKSWAQPGKIKALLTFESKGE